MSGPSGRVVLLAAASLNSDDGAQTILFNHQNGAAFNQVVGYCSSSTGSLSVSVIPVGGISLKGTATDAAKATAMTIDWATAADQILFDYGLWEGIVVTPVGMDADTDYQVIVSGAE